MQKLSMLFIAFILISNLSLASSSSSSAPIIKKDLEKLMIARAVMLECKDSQGFPGLPPELYKMVIDYVGPRWELAKTVILPTGHEHIIGMSADGTKIATIKDNPENQDDGNFKSALRDMNVYDLISGGKKIVAGRYTNPGWWMIPRYNWIDPSRPSATSGTTSPNNFIMVARAINKEIEITDNVQDRFLDDHRGKDPRKFPPEIWGKIFDRKSEIFPGHTKKILIISVPDSKTVISVSEDQTLKTWKRINNAQEVKALIKLQEAQIELERLKEEAANKERFCTIQ